MRVRKVWEEPEVFVLLPYLAIKRVFAKRETLRDRKVSGMIFMDTTLSPGRGRGANPKGRRQAIILANFLQKLHENGARRVRFWHPPWIRQSQVKPNDPN